MTNTGSSTKTWRDVLVSALTAGARGFEGEFFAIYGGRIWQPNDADRSAAHSFHVELISRIATQPLGYSEGVDELALTSVFELFGRARAITEANPGGATFETLVWYLLNTRVRPFTSRWHPKSEAGALRALDNSDEFRAELVCVQSALIELDRVLQLINEHEGYSVRREDRPDHVAIDDEMSRSVGWRPMGAKPSGSELADFAESERTAVEGRREQYGIDKARPWAAGLALSGGGIRSATFSMGVLVSLAKRDLLHQFDYLSTVSGGGYAGSFLTQLMGGAGDPSGVSLKGSDLPFTRDEGESQFLRRIRQGASYLSGSFWERLAVAMAQAHGIFINFLVVAFIAAAFAYVDFVLRQLIPPRAAAWAAVLSPLALAAVFIAIPLIRRIRPPADGSQFGMALLGITFALPILWAALGTVHATWQPLAGWGSALYQTITKEVPTASTISVSLAAIASVSALAGAIFTDFSKLRPLLLSILIAILFLVLEALAFNLYNAVGLWWATIAFAVSGMVALYLWFALDVNALSLHGYYRAKLSAAFLIDRSLQPANPLRLTEFNPRFAHFPIINCALNVPGSKNPAMRGRLSDIFAFTPVAAGAPVLGYSSTKEWEVANPHLDLGAAMALSGAAVSPQMGLRTTRYASFWLTVLNMRLGAWLKKPTLGTKMVHGPGVRHLLRELTASANENGEFIHVSDGGHIENLGVYELLRRRCRFIVAVDGENDPKMTFHGLTNLQRLAYIDLGIVLELDLDDLRLGQTGYSRSHFRLCRIVYPAGRQDSQAEIGYLVYLKLSLTGNEGEFLRRYKLDEPAFPHHGTADQFFSEPQFEAYRALGEHIGEKLFLPAITGPLGRNVSLENWFRQLGRSLLDPRPTSTGNEPAVAP
jgi:hypothetical protein